MTDDDSEPEEIHVSVLAVESNFQNVLSEFLFVGTSDRG